MSSRRVPIAQIREGYKRKAIAGEVRGFEVVPFITSTLIVDVTGTGGGRLIKLYCHNQASIPEGVSPVYCYNLTRSQGHKVDMKNNSFSWLSPIGSEAFGNPSLNIWEVGDEVLILKIVNANQYSSDKYLSKHKQANPTWTDIIGDPANIAAAFPNGVEGQWIPIIPDGSNKFYALNRKFINGAAGGTEMEQEYTLDNGSTWGASTVSVDSINNGRTASYTPDWVVMSHYETQANFTQDDVNSVVLDLGGVFSSNKSGISTGLLLNQSLTGVIGTVPFNIGDKGQVEVPLINQALKPTGLLDGRLEYGYIDHITLGLYAGTSLRTVKTLDYLSSENGVAKLCYAYKEMVYDVDAIDGRAFTEVIGSTLQSSLNVGQLYFVNVPALQGFYRQVLSIIGARLDDTRWSKDIDGNIRWANGAVGLELWNGTGWGDNNQFEITDNQLTLTDDNGNTVLYGTASFDTQYFIDISHDPLVATPYEGEEE